MNAIEKLRDIIQENNYFDTLAGQRFVEWNDIKNIAAVISFSGRSKKQECYKLTSESDSESDALYVTHLYIDKYGETKVQLGSEDTDEIGVILHPSGIPIENFDEEILEEWVDLLTW
jgi:hypothetical protein